MLLSHAKAGISNPLVAFTTNDVVTGGYVGFMREGMGVETLDAKSWAHTTPARIVFRPSPISHPVSADIQLHGMTPF